MAACGKHFPGHGYAKEDSHEVLPVDERSFASLEKEDLSVFARLIGQGLDAIMPGHLLYSKIDKKAVSFSEFWLKEILRERLDFKGLVLSDSLTMKGAWGEGDIVHRVKNAAAVGMDIFLICNAPSEVDRLLKASGEVLSEDKSVLWQKLRLKKKKTLFNQEYYLKMRSSLESLWDKNFTLFRSVGEK